MWKRHALTLHLAVHIHSKAALSALEGSIQESSIRLHLNMQL